MFYRMAFIILSIYQVFSSKEKTAHMRILLEGRRRETDNSNIYRFAEIYITRPETFRLAIGDKRQAQTYCNYRGQASMPW